MKEDNKSESLNYNAGVASVSAFTTAPASSVSWPQPRPGYVYAKASSSFFFFCGSLESHTITIRMDINQSFPSNHLPHTFSGSLKSLLFVSSFFNRTMIFIWSLRSGVGWLRRASQNSTMLLFLYPIRRTLTGRFDSLRFAINSAAEGSTCPCNCNFEFIISKTKTFR